MAQKKSPSRRRSARSQARRLVDVVQEAVDDGAKSVEEIHKRVAALPLEVLDRLDLFEKASKDMRRVEEQSIGAVYDLIRSVNREVGKLARELLAKRRPARPRGAGATAKKKKKAVPRTEGAAAASTAA